ncbi:hypothetical protein Taro_039874 [Colocasia esculenta]|uniref:Uncharacterized protein n=1 Tax=Colocasia esculenta TaxID=4460 RepID=A0A843WH24_COLES|nr:hypothetical protein [Colocasia esculenta]
MTLIIYDDYAATFQFSALSCQRCRHSSPHGRNAKEAKVPLEKKRRSFEDACNNLPPTYDSSQWRHMCEIRDREDSKRVSERNKSNRCHLSMPYRRGRMNIHQLNNDFMEREGCHPTHPEMFQMTQGRTAPDGSVMWSNEQSRQMMDQMTQLMNPTPSEESDATANPPVLTPEEAFRQVFGRDRPGRIRCGGRGQTLRSWYGPSECGSSSNTVYQRLLEEQSQQKSEISQQKSEISQQKSEIERMKKIIEDQEPRIAAQSTDIDVRVEAQVEARLAELKTQMLQSMDDRVLELIRMSGSGAPVLPEDETDEEVGDGEDEGTFGEDE